MKTKHTPGPWTPIDDGQGISFVIDSEDRSIAEVMWDNALGPKLGEEHYANGYLIAAAPELLEVAYIAMNACNVLVSECNLAGELTAANIWQTKLNKVRMVIARAEGA